jgi:hypothetical protein
MNPDKNFTPESGPKIPTAEEVISIFKEQGETPESVEKYKLWYTDKQRETSESTSQYAILSFNIEVTSVLLEAGMIDDAREYCDTAWCIVNDEMNRVNEEEMPEELQVLHDRLVALDDRLY